MNYLADIHTHTVASGHAKNTILEMALAASEQGLCMLGITDHTMTMPGTCPESYFWELDKQSRSCYDVELVLGAELNILDYHGNVDMSQELLARMDVAIASIHPTIGYTTGNKAENTKALLGAVRNPYINIIGHPDDGNVPVDYEELVYAAKEHHTLLEINNNSLTPGSWRKDPRIHDATILTLCKKLQHPIIIGSDAHSITKVGSHEYALELIREVDFPEELVLNFYPEKLKTYFNKYQ